MSLPAKASAAAKQHLRLHLVSGIGPRRFRQLLDHFGSVEKVFDATPAQWQHLHGIGDKISSTLQAHHGLQEIEQELERAARYQLQIICQDDDEYPRLLREIPDAPICLYVRGRLLPADNMALAIVGPRRASHYGNEQAYQWAMEVARCGMTVVSGLARGVDAQAHRGALAVKGRTVAVIGCGMQFLAEHENRELADQIVDAGGAIVSELPIGRPPDPQNFPARNRIIAGLSLGTLVIEAALRSGALLTADAATEYNREVFALPGRVDSPASFGANRLIQRQQAKMVLSLKDLLEELGHAQPELQHNFTQRNETLFDQLQNQLSDEEQQLLGVLADGDLDLPAIVIKTRLAPERLSHLLVMLQMKGLIEQLPGQRYARLHK
ncbi:MAG: hypothetical protein HJJLKODD_02107 [Phycisphaerae bacterium]|nr:hypothetical protein [Phycisphaerae bacterium]